MRTPSAQSSNQTTVVIDLKYVYSYRSMPLPYSLDLRWRIVWVYLTQNLSQSRIGLLFNVSDHTVGQMISLFNQTGDVKPRL